MSSSSISNRRSCVLLLLESYNCTKLMGFGLGVDMYHTALYMFDVES
jgi:hypothetical protein